MRKKVTKLGTSSSEGPRKIRVLAVDDSVLILRVIREALGKEPDIDLVGVASNGVIALDKIPVAKPDLVLLDVDMPVMDGLEVLRQLRHLDSPPRVVMYSSLTERCAQITLKALALGADDYVPKGENDYNSASGIKDAIVRAREELLPKIRQFFRTEITPLPTPSRVPADAPLVSTRSEEPPAILAIASSTGGPSALGQILPALPAAFPLPIVLVQHMPPTFTTLLANQLNASCALEVREARDNEDLFAGTVYLAPGAHHMRVLPAGRGWKTSLDQSPPENACRPSADVLFRSLARLPNTNVLAVVLTGMGNDGTRGAAELKSTGSSVLVQDANSSVVWGMPGSIAEAGLADEILPLDQFARAILQRCTARRS